MIDRGEAALRVLTRLGELDAISSALSTPRLVDAARVLQLVGERDRVLDSLAAVLASVDVAALPIDARRRLQGALERSAQLGELARRAVEQQGAVLTRELQVLETLAESPEQLAGVGRLDAEG
jgi:hypothetical protein